MDLGTARCHAEWQGLEQVVNSTSRRASARTNGRYQKGQASQRLAEAFADVAVAELPSPLARHRTPRTRRRETHHRRTAEVDALSSGGPDAVLRSSWGDGQPAPIPLPSFRFDDGRSSSSSSTGHLGPSAAAQLIEQALSPRGDDESVQAYCHRLRTLDVPHSERSGDETAMAAANGCSDGTISVSLPSDRASKQRRSSKHRRNGHMDITSSPPRGRQFVGGQRFEATPPKLTRKAEHCRREVTDTKACIKRGEMQNAASKLNNIIEQYPRAASLRTMRAMVLYKLGLEREAEAHELEANARQLRAGSPTADDKAEARELLEEHERCEDQARSFWMDAFSDAQRAVNISPKEINANYWAGLSAGKLGNPEEGVAYIQKCLQATPSDRKFLAAWNDLHPQTGRSRPYRAHGECAYVAVETLNPLTQDITGGITNRVPTERPFVPIAGERIVEKKATTQKVPPVRAQMDADWKMIDLSDIVFELTIIHEAIVGSLADGEVDEAEAYLIDMKLTSAEINPKLRKKIQDSLKFQNKQNGGAVDVPAAAAPGDPRAEAIKAAAKSGDAAAVKALLADGVVVDVQDESGYTPLYHATMYGKENVVALCIGQGATVDLENNNGVTPLMAAARDGVTTIVTMLLEAGADAYQVDEFGRTASSVAEEKGFEETSSFVKQWVESHAAGSHTRLLVSSSSGGSPRGGGGGGGAGSGDPVEVHEMLKALCPPGYHRGYHGAEMVYAQPLVRGVLKAALIGAKPPWLPKTADNPGYVDDAALRKLGVPQNVREMLIPAMLGQDGKMEKEGRVLPPEAEATLRRLCMTCVPVSELVDNAEKMDKVCSLLNDAVLEADDVDALALVNEMLMHRSDYLGGQGGARVGEAPNYPDPTEEQVDPGVKSRALGDLASIARSRYDRPMDLLACGCSLQSCSQCENPCDDWDKILADLDENHGRYKTIFRLYGFASDGRPEMGMKQFGDFCEDRKITDPTNAKAEAGDMLQIHQRSNIDHTIAAGRWIDFYDRQFMAPKSLRAERDRIEAESVEKELRSGQDGKLNMEVHDLSMGPKEFINGMIRAAHAKYQGNVPSLYEQWAMFTENNLVSQAIPTTI